MPPSENQNQQELPSLMTAMKRSHNDLAGINSMGTSPNNKNAPSTLNETINPQMDVHTMNMTSPSRDGIQKDVPRPGTTTTEHFGMQI